MFASIILSVVFTYLFVQVALVWLRNRRAFKYFHERSNGLPILPEAKPFSGHLYKIVAPKNWLAIKNWHEEYGNSFGVFFCNQLWVPTKDLDLIKLVEIDEAQTHIDRSIFGLPFAAFDHSIFQINGDHWRRIRRAVAPAFSNYKVRSDEVSGDIQSIVDKFASSLDSKLLRQVPDECGQRSIKIDVGDNFHRYALAVIFLTFYKQANIVDFETERDHWVDLINYGAERIVNPLSTVSVMFPFLRPICAVLAYFHSTGIIISEILKYITEATDINRVAREQFEKSQRKTNEATGAKMKDFSTVTEEGKFRRRLVDTIIDAFLDKKMNYKDFKGTLMFLLLSGFKTSADTLSSMVWHLARDSEIQEKLRKAILEEGIDADYLGWCISETTRWHPPAGLGAGRVLSKDVTINEILYPKGAFIMPSTYSIHHDPKIWPNHDKFDPERWRESSKFHPAAFMSFGLGPRNCVGGKLAVHEIKLVMRMILSKYRIEKCAETVEKYNFTSPGLIYNIPDETVIIKLVQLPKKNQTT